MAKAAIRSESAPAPEPAPVANGLSAVESWLTRAAGVISTVAGCVTTAQHDLPVAVGAILTAAGPVVYLVERYWSKIRKAL